MEPFLPSKWSNSVGPSYCIADTEGNCIDVIPVVVTPPVVNPAPGEVIVTPVPTTGIINADAPVTTSPTITQTTTTPTAPAAPTLVNPNAHLNEPDPILQSAIVGIPVIAVTSTTPAPSNWFPNMFGLSNGSSSGGGSSSAATDKPNYLTKYKNYLLLAAVIGTGILVFSKNKKSKK